MTSSGASLLQYLPAVHFACRQGSSSEAFEALGHLRTAAVTSAASEQGVADGTTGNREDSAKSALASALQVSDSYGFTPLLHAVQRGLGSLVSELLAAGAHPAVPRLTPSLNSALHVAALKGDIVSVRHLVEALRSLPPPAKAVTPLPEHAAPSACAAATQLDAAATHLDAAALDPLSSVATTLTGCAAAAAAPVSAAAAPETAGATDAVQTAAPPSGGPLASVDLLSANGSTPLLYACGVGHMGVAAVLLKAGADPSRPNDEGVTPLMASASGGHPNVTQMLLRTLQDRAGDRVRTDAAAGGTPSSAAPALAVTVGAADVNGSTALHYAARRGCSRSLALLTDAVAAVAAASVATVQPASLAREMSAKMAESASASSPAGGSAAVMTEGGTGVGTAPGGGACALWDLLLRRNAGGRDVLAEARLSGDAETVRVVETRLAGTEQPLPELPQGASVDTGKAARPSGVAGATVELATETNKGACKGESQAKPIARACSAGKAGDGPAASPAGSQNADQTPVPAAACAALAGSGDAVCRAEAAAAAAADAEAEAVTEAEAGTAAARPVPRTDGGLSTETTGADPGGGPGNCSGPGAAADDCRRIPEAPRTRGSSDGSGWMAARKPKRGPKPSPAAAGSSSVAGSGSQQGGHQAAAAGPAGDTGKPAGHQRGPVQPQGQPTTQSKAREGAAARPPATRAPLTSAPAPGGRPRPGSASKPGPSPGAPTSDSKPASAWKSALVRAPPSSAAPKGCADNRGQTSLAVTKVCVLSSTECGIGDAPKVEVVSADPLPAAPAAEPSVAAAAAWEAEALGLMQASLPAGTDLDLLPSHLCGLGLGDLSAAQLEGLEVLHRAALARIAEARLTLAVGVEVARVEEDRRRQLEIRVLQEQRTGANIPAP